MSSVGATIAKADAGGFTAVASNGDIDRDGERILPGCFSPLPASVPVHLDHTMRAATVVARGRPYYSGDELLIDARFSGDVASQDIRAKVAEGIIDSLSIVFRGLQWRDIDGVRTCVKGELLAADLVSVPSNPGARVLAVRSLAGWPSPIDEARRVAADAVMTLARLEIASVKHQHTRPGSHRRLVDDVIREALVDRPGPTSARVRAFLRSL